ELPRPDVRSKSRPWPQGTEPPRWCAPGLIRDPDKHFGSWRIIDALRAPIGRMGSLSLFGRCATSPRQPSAIRPYVTPNELNGFRISGFHNDWPSPPQPVILANGKRPGE